MLSGSGSDVRILNSFQPFLEEMLEILFVKNLKACEIPLGVSGLENDSLFLVLLFLLCRQEQLSPNSAYSNQKFYILLKSPGSSLYFPQIIFSEFNYRFTLESI